MAKEPYKDLYKDLYQDQRIKRDEALGEVMSERAPSSRQNQRPLISRNPTPTTLKQNAQARAHAEALRAAQTAQITALAAHLNAQTKIKTFSNSQSDPLPDLRLAADQMIESSLKLSKLMEEIFTRYHVDEAQAHAVKITLFNLHQKTESFTDKLTQAVKNIGKK